MEYRFRIEEQRSLDFTDEDPDNADNTILLYTGRSHPNLDFEESDEAHPECASRRNADSFEPRDAVKGDVARMLFYMDVRYAGADGVPDLALVDEDSNSGPLLGHLCTLLA